MPMRLKQYFHISCFIFLGLTSCRQRFFYTEAFKEPVDARYDQDLVIDTRFGSDAGDFLVFEIDVENYTDQDFVLSYRDIILKLDDQSLSRPVIFPALIPEELIDDLETERDLAHGQRKTRNLVNAVSIGLNVLAVAVSPGSYSQAAPFYLASDVAIGFFDDRRSYHLIEGSIDDRISYLDEWVLEDVVLQPGEKGSWDILFEHILADHHAQLVVQIPGKDRKFSYQLTIQTGSR